MDVNVSCLDVSAYEVVVYFDVLCPSMKDRIVCEGYGGGVVAVDDGWSVLRNVKFTEKSPELEHFRCSQGNGSVFDFDG
ncbi:hypothetical protein MA16_Dca026496 [Dendrobium catenatum]|uniref:Uncharacterized protein n=1 Tax=Dendrobium catenatum TaxID=906689 RepID=A0A2I0VG78_9ASPA|nr:hypothetical protein MA16_Dca026496 [Dendrobium catenatum]